MLVKHILKLFVGLFLPVVLLCCQPLKLQKTETQHSIISTNTIDSSIYKTILPYKVKLDDKMNEVIGFAPVALVKNLPESNLADFFADVMLQRSLQMTDLDTAHLVALFNSGGLRTSVPQGDVHVGNMFELMPFENELVFIKLKGADLKTILDAIASKGGAPVAGLRFVISQKKADNITVHQQALDTALLYTIATSDYLAKGGDNFFSVESPKEVTSTHLLLRDILIDHCREQKKLNKPIQCQPDGRISIAK